jgi:hypothetical protein
MSVVKSRQHNRIPPARLSTPLAAIILPWQAKLHSCAKYALRI